MAPLTIEERKQAICDTLHSIHADGKPADYDTNHLLNLITVTDAVATLCWNIQAATTLPKPFLRTSLAAQDIKEEATKITSFCLAELDDMYGGIKGVGMTLVSAQADQNIRGAYVLDRLDIDVNPASRIELLIKALGTACPCWPHKKLNNQADRPYRAETIAMLAYHAVCAIIATNRQLIANHTMEG